MHWLLPVADLRVSSVITADSPPPPKKKEGKVVQSTGSKGPSGITGKGGRGPFFFPFCFFFSLFETTEICFGSSKMEILLGKRHFTSGKKCH